jgi:hypothetical protein
MGLNKTEGELLEGIGRGKVAPVEKWAGILGMVEQAAQEAANYFHKAGAPKDITLTEDNFVIQEFHMIATVVFVFWLPINGVDHYYPYTFKLGERVLRELAAVGKWPIGFSIPHLETRH